MQHTLDHTSAGETPPSSHGLTLTTHAAPRRVAGVLAALFAAGVPTARASIFQGETLDKVADVLTWVVLIVAPTVAITVFWLVHILPEKIAEKRHHPQAKAIQCLCLLSLLFGGLLWPLAWLWTYSKPVFYRMAYGTDKGEHAPGGGEPAPSGAGKGLDAAEAQELERLRRRVAELEGRQAGAAEVQKGKE